jgi:hypothetical protein
VKIEPINTVVIKHWKLKGGLTWKRDAEKLYKKNNINKGAYVPGNAYCYYTSPGNLSQGKQPLP